MNDRRKQTSNNTNHSGKKQLNLIENSLENYNNFITKKFIQYSKFDKSQNFETKNYFRVLDFGAGKGSIALNWKNRTGQHIECLEPDVELQSELRTLKFTCWDSISAVKGKFNFIFSSNVLEHIKNDEEVIKDLANLLENNGRICTYVPAFMVLFSELDYKVGHYRRYRKKELISKIEYSPLKIIRIEYVDSLGFFVTLLFKIVNWEKTNLLTFRTLKFYDNIIFPISFLLDKVTNGKILGKNILLTAQKIS